MLFVPVILIIGFVFFKNIHNGWGKIAVIILTLISLFTFCFIWPGPLGIKTYPPYVYWSGGNTKGNGKDVFKAWRRRQLEKLGFEYVEDE